MTLSQGPRTDVTWNPAISIADRYVESEKAFSPPASWCTGWDSQELGMLGLIVHDVLPQGQEIPPRTEHRAHSRTSVGRSRAWCRTWRA